MSAASNGPFTVITENPSALDGPSRVSSSSSSTKLSSSPETSGFQVLLFAMAVVLNHKGAMR